MGAAKALTSAVGKTVNKGIRTVTGNPKTPSPPPSPLASATKRLAGQIGTSGGVAGTIVSPLTKSNASTSSVPSTNSFGGIISTTDNSTDSERRGSGFSGLADIPNTETDLTEAEREEDDSISVKSPGIEADDEEKRRDAVEKANEYMMSSENY